MKSSRLNTVFLAVAATFLLTQAAATLAADAGQLLQQIEKDRPQTLPAKTAPDLAPEAQAVKPTEGVTVTLSAIQFKGNTLLDTAQLNTIVASYLKRPISFAELQKAPAAVAEAYRKAGWIARAYLPQQEIQNDTVTLQIVEAVLGEYQFEGGPSQRINAERINATLKAAQAQGAPLNTQKLDRVLLILDDLPGLIASGSLSNGSQPGQTNLIVKQSDEARFTGDAGLDNTGARSTGSTRLTASLSLNSPAKLGDQATANLLHSDGSDYLRLAYSIPVAYDGWRVGLSTSALNYKLVGSEFSSLNAKGSSSTLGIDANYPLLRSRAKNLYLGLNYDNKAFNNEANQATSSKYGIASYSVSISGNLFDDYHGGGANSANLTLVSGQVALGTLDTSENASLGGFTKLRYSLNRQQFLTDNDTLYGAISGQRASNTLDSAEKFYLGGAGGVRAYPASEGGGNNGDLINLELRRKLPQNFNLTGFYDYGNISNSDGSKSYSLDGVGLALDWTGKSGLNLKGTLAHRLSSNPNPTTSGNDQDGSSLHNRLWLQATLRF